MADKDDPCEYIIGEAHKYCMREHDGGSSADNGPGGGGLTDGASQHVKDLADSLINTIHGLVTPKDAWAPASADSVLYEPFLWLGQHLAIAIFVCVVVVCALTAWQGVPRLRQMGASTGWTLAAVAGMASVPGAVMLLNRAVSAAFTAAFDSNEVTLFGAIRDDMTRGADSGNPLALLIIISALVVAIAFACLVFMTRQPGILAFVCIAPLVVSSVAREGDMTAVKEWAQRLLGLMFAPFALLIVAPFVQLTKGSLVMDGLLVIAADVLMLRMIFHGVPYIGPRVARAARSVVERRTDNRLVRRAVRLGVPDFYEEESNPRVPRTVATPGRALAHDRGVLFAAYGGTQQQRPGRLTTDSAVKKARVEETDRAARTARISQARRDARAAAQPPAPQRRTPTPRPTPAPPPSPPRNP
ncbi:hypothetical protein ABT272_36605 [Streptomyces sp900105245]|uniref:Integral membrane protein n=1 Tax=Streptomyces sp. 900105245 TaxID=3154379 RepID=A0ABV1UHR7_9ACTN